MRHSFRSPYSTNKSTGPYSCTSRLKTPLTRLLRTATVVSGPLSMTFKSPSVTFPQETDFVGDGTPTCETEILRTTTRRSARCQSQHLDTVDGLLGKNESLHIKVTGSGSATIVRRAAAAVATSAHQSHLSRFSAETQEASPPTAPKTSSDKSSSPLHSLIRETIQQELQRVQHTPSAITQFQQSSSSPTQQAQATPAAIPSTKPPMSSLASRVTPTEYTRLATSGDTAVQQPPQPTAPQVAQQSQIAATPTTRTFVLPSIKMESFAPNSITASLPSIQQNTMSTSTSEQLCIPYPFTIIPSGNEQQRALSYFTVVASPNVKKETKPSTTTPKVPTLPPTQQTNAVPPKTLDKKTPELKPMATVKTPAETAASPLMLRLHPMHDGDFMFFRTRGSDKVRIAQLQGSSIALIPNKKTRRRHDSSHDCHRSKKRHRRRASKARHHKRSSKRTPKPEKEPTPPQVQYDYEDWIDCTLKDDYMPAPIAAFL